MVDDRPANLVALEATLASLGHRLVKASSGEEALKALLVEEFALILLDVQMPGLDGFETAALIKRHPRTRHTPIIFVTAIHRDASHAFKGYAEGGVDYLLKPFDPTVLRSKVSVFVELFLKEKKLQAQAVLLRERDRQDLERKSERRFQKLTDSIPICVWALRSDGTVHYSNRAWFEYSGLTTAATAQANLADLVHPDDFAGALALWQAARDDGQAVDVQCRLRRGRDGAYRWHIGRVVPERDDAGQLVGWVATATDIEDHKRAEEAYASLVVDERQARQEAEAANRAKDEFLATLSHELRTPLNAMIGWTRMLRTRSLPPAKAVKALETIERNAKAQADLIEDILDVSRIITGKLRIEIQAADLRTIIDAAIEAVRPAAEGKGIQLEKIIHEVPARFSADPARMQQVIWNLLSNAIKFTSAGGRVCIDVDQVGTDVVIEVKDNGCGIAPEFKPFVFDRFRQLDSTSKRSHGGLGLGLAIVRHLVELHGGTVSVDSEGIGEGATFTVRLPARTAAVQAHAVERSASRPPPAESEVPAEENPLRLDGIKVLLVDDEPDARELLCEVLQHYGAIPIPAVTADEALTLLRAERPDVLLSDIGLPGEDGYSLVSRVRALPPEEGGATPAAALTAYARSEDGRRALSAGFHRHAVKPIQPHALALLVAELVVTSSPATSPTPPPATAGTSSPSAKPVQTDKLPDKHRAHG
jgi:PAS domain S-box-containing protein